MTNNSAVEESSFSNTNKRDKGTLYQEGVSMLHQQKQGAYFPSIRQMSLKDYGVIPRAVLQIFDHIKKVNELFF